MRLRFLLAGLALACCGAGALAGGEPPRRLAAELAIMAGDARQILAGLPAPLEREGLILRLKGSLSSLPLLMRRADADPRVVATLRTTIARDDWRTFAALLETLARRHPFDARHLLAAPATPQTIALGASIHRETCAGCHDAPAIDSLLPAKNLSAQLARMPHEEFAARLWLGVRGVRSTNYANPFNDAELAALIAFYRSGRTQPR